MKLSFQLETMIAVTRLWIKMIAASLAALIISDTNPECEAAFPGLIFEIVLLAMEVIIFNKLCCSSRRDSGLQSNSTLSSL